MHPFHSHRTLAHMIETKNNQTTTTKAWSLALPSAPSIAFHGSVVSLTAGPPEYRCLALTPNRSQPHRSLLCSIEEDAGFIEALKLLHRRLDREVNPVTTSACDQLLAESLQRMELPDYEGSPDQREVEPGSESWFGL